MENNINQNLTQSEVQPLDRLGEFDRSIQFLSDLPTDKAMKDLSKMNYIPESVKKVIETMALSKMDLVRSLQLMDWRGRALQASLIGDRAMSDFIKENPDYEINVAKK